MQLFQVFSRNNDVNGNPYRLIHVYQVSEDDALLAAVYEDRSSRPNIVRTLRDQGAIEIEGVHLSATEYNRLKRQSQQWGIEITSTD